MTSRVGMGRGCGWRGPHLRDDEDAPGVYLPTEEEIAVAAREIREGRMVVRRSKCKSPVVRVEKLPVVRVEVQVARIYSQNGRRIA